MSWVLGGDGVQKGGLDGYKGEKVALTWKYHCSVKGIGGECLRWGIVGSTSQLSSFSYRTREENDLRKKKIGARLWWRSGKLELGECIENNKDPRNIVV